MVRETVETWEWVRLRLPKGEKLEEAIRVKGIRKIGKDAMEWSGRWMVDSSFLPQEDGALVLPPPCELLITGVAYMFSPVTNILDITQLRDNYSYELRLWNKWYHHGPMRMFPVIVDWDRRGEVVKSPPPVPWMDMWDTPLLVPNQMPIDIALIGVPFTPLTDIDVTVGIKGKFSRGVQ